MKQPLILINDFKGGITLNEKLGRADQFHTGEQLDFGTKLGKLAPGPAWEHIVDGDNGDSAYVPDEFQGILATQEDAGLYFGADDTNIYQLTASKCVIATNSDQTGTIRSMIEHEGYMYYVQDTTIGRADLAGAFDHDWTTGMNSSTYHPMHKAADGNVYVGHGNDVGSIIGSTWSADALDLPAGWKIRTLSDFGYLFLAIGADDLGTGKTTQTKIFLWNRSDDFWNDEITIPEKGIKAMVFDSGYLWIWAGRSCNLYVVPEGSRKVTKIWGFSKENPSDTYEVYPNAVLARNGTIYFALSGVGAESIDNNPNGIYSFPADPNKFSLNLVYTGNPTTTGADTRFKSLGLYPSSAGDTIYASFYDFNHGTAANKNQLKREDIVDNPYNDTAIYESFRYDAPPDKRMKTQNFGVTFDSLPTGCNITLSYKRDNETSYTDVFSNYGTATTSEKITRLGLLCNSLKLKLAIRGASTSSFKRPFIKSIYVTGSLVAKQK